MEEVVVMGSELLAVIRAREDDIEPVGSFQGIAYLAEHRVAGGHLACVDRAQPVLEAVRRLRLSERDAVEVVRDDGRAAVPRGVVEVADPGFARAVGSVRISQVDPEERVLVGGQSRQIPQEGIDHQLVARLVGGGCRAVRGAVRLGPAAAVHDADVGGVDVGLEALVLEQLLHHRRHRARRGDLLLRHAVGAGVGARGDRRQADHRHTAGDDGVGHHHPLLEQRLVVRARGVDGVRTEVVLVERVDGEPDDRPRATGPGLLHGYAQRWSRGVLGTGGAGEEPDHSRYPRARSPSRVASSTSISVSAGLRRTTVAR